MVSSEGISLQHRNQYRVEILPLPVATDAMFKSDKIDGKWNPSNLYSPDSWRWLKSKVSYIFSCLMLKSSVLYFFSTYFIWSLRHFGGTLEHAITQYGQSQGLPRVMDDVWLIIKIRVSDTMFFFIYGKVYNFIEKASGGMPSMYGRNWGKCKLCVIDRSGR